MKPAKGVAVTVQVVVYDNTEGEVRRAIIGAAAAAVQAVASGSISSTSALIGDSSPRPCLSAAFVGELNDVFAESGLGNVGYRHFGANLGSGGGSNELAKGSDSDLIWVLNPDTYVAPTALAHLVAAVAPPSVAAAEARQVPIEHPKGFDPHTGETAWVSGACVLLKRSAFAAVDGFDDRFFPMYCDDVDLSWRLRLAGWRLVHQPLAVVFHDKRLDPSGHPAASDFEHESGVLSRLFLAHRYDRSDVVEATLAWVDASGAAPHRRAAETYRRRLAADDVPRALAGAAQVADLDSDFYGPSRFRY